MKAKALGHNENFLSSFNISYEMLYHNVIINYAITLHHVGIKLKYVINIFSVGKNQQRWALVIQRLCRILSTNRKGREKQILITKILIAKITNANESKESAAFQVKDVRNFRILKIKL